LGRRVDEVDLRFVGVPPRRHPRLRPARSQPAKSNSAVISREIVHNCLVRGRDGIDLLAVLEDQRLDRRSFEQVRFEWASLPADGAIPEVRRYPWIVARDVRILLAAVGAPVRRTGVA